MARAPKRQWEESLRSLESHDWTWLRGFRGGELARLTDPNPAFDVNGLPTLELLRRLGDRGFTLQDRAEGVGIGLMIAELEQHFGVPSVRKPQPADLPQFARHAAEEFGRAAAMLLFIFVANWDLPATPLVRRDWSTITRQIRDAETRWDPRVAGPTNAEPVLDVDVVSPESHDTALERGGEPSVPLEPAFVRPELERPVAPATSDELPRQTDHQHALRELVDTARVLATSAEHPVRLMADCLARGQALPPDHGATLQSLGEYERCWSELSEAVRSAGVAGPLPDTLSAIEAEIDRIIARAAGQRDRAERRARATRILAGAGRPDLDPDDELSELLVQIAGAGTSYWEDHRDLVDPLLQALGPVTLLAILGQTSVEGEPLRSTPRDDAQAESLKDAEETPDILDIEPNEPLARAQDDTSPSVAGASVHDEHKATGTVQTRSGGSPQEPPADAAVAPRDVPAKDASQSTARASQTGREPKQSASEATTGPHGEAVSDRRFAGDVRSAPSGLASRADQLETQVAAAGLYPEVGWLREAALRDSGQPDGEYYRQGWHVAAIALDSGHESDDENARVAAAALERLSELPQSLEQDMPRVLGVAGLRLNLAYPFRVNPGVIEDLLREASWAPHHDEFLDSLLDLMRNGQAVGGDRESLRQAKMARLQGLSKEVQEVIDKAPRQRKVYHRASRVWWRVVEQRADADEMTPMGRALHLMARGSAGASARQHISEIADMDSDALSDLIEEVDAALGSPGPLRRPIEGTAREQLIDAMWDLVILARRYRDLLQQTEATPTDIHASDERRIARLEEAALEVYADVVMSPSDSLVLALADWVTSQRGSSGPPSRSILDHLLVGMLRLDGFALDPRSLPTSDPFSLRALRLPDGPGFESLLDIGLATEASLRRRAGDLAKSGQVLEAALVVESIERRGSDTSSEHTILQTAIDALTRENYARATESRASLEMLNTWVNEDREEVDRVLGALDTVEIKPSAGTLTERAAGVVMIRQELDSVTSQVNDVVGRAAEDIRQRLDRVPQPDQRHEIEERLGKGDLAKAIGLFIKSQWEDEEDSQSGRLTDLLRDFVDNYLPYIEQASQALGDDWPDGALSDGTRKIWGNLSRQLQPLTNPDDHDVRGWINEILGIFGLKLVVNSRPRPDVARLMDHRTLHLQIVAAKFQGIPGLSSTAEKTIPMVVHRPVKRAAAAIEEVLEEFDRSPGVLVYLGRLSEVERRQVAERARSRPVQLLLVDRTLIEFAVEKGLRPSEALPLALAFSAGQPYAPFARGSIPPGMFYGRRGEAKDILQANENFFVSGGRQLGKSALLKHVLEEFGREAEHVAVFLDIEGSEASGDQPYRLWSALADKLSPSIKGMQEVHRNQRRDVFDLFRTELTAWLSENRTRRVLVLLDEADKFLDRQSGDPEQMLRLRALAEESDHRFRLVIAGLQKVHAYASRSNSPFGHFARPVVIRPLDVRSALALVREPAAALGVEVEERAAWQVLTITNRHPGLIQLFMRSLMETVFARKPRKGEPPYRVTDEFVVRLFARDEHLRTELRRRFELTVTLDPKYQAITFAVARHQLDSRAPFAAENLKEVLDADAPEGFKSLPDYDFRVILEELGDLGVLRIVEDGDAIGVRLATPMVKALLGDRSRIKARYEEACGEDFSGPLEGARREWSLDGTVPCISHQQMEQIVDPLAPSPRLSERRSPIQWAFGTTALGFPGLPDLVKREVSVMRDRRDDDRVHVFSSSEVLQGALTEVSALKALAVLRPGSDPADAIEQAVAELRSWAAGEGRRGLVLVDESRPDLWDFVLSASSDARLTLTPWDEQALKAEKRDNRNWLDTRRQRRAILDACGGWPELLRDVLDDPSFAFGPWRQKTVGRCLDPAWAEGFLIRVGLRALPGMIDLLRDSVVEDLDGMRDPEWLPEPWAWEDLAGIDDQGRSLDQLALLGVVRRAEPVGSGPGLAMLSAPVMRAIGAVSDVRHG